MEIEARSTKQLEYKEPIYRVNIAKPVPQILIASESKIGEWLGDKKLEQLMRAGMVEVIENIEDWSYGTAAL